MLKSMFNNLNTTISRYIGCAFLFVIVLLIGILLTTNLPHASMMLIFLILLLLGVFFVINKLFVFKNDDLSLSVLSEQLLLFVVANICSLLIFIGLIGLLPESIVIYSFLIASVLMTLVNYFFYRFLFEISNDNTSKIPAKAQIKFIIKKTLLIVALALPVIIFSFGLLKSNARIIPGDPDYYFQLYEAFRRSVLEFHQFPFINPWIGGGIPLFANIQFGLISIQTPFVLVFGSVLGVKIAVVAYQLIAFFGFKQLFEKGFKANKVKSILLAYTPVFGSFFVDRVVAGHFTFLLVAFAPWLILLYIQRQRLRSWIYFGLIYSLMIWSSPHYITIMSMVIIGFFFLYETLTRLILGVYKKDYKDTIKQIKNDMIFFAKAGILVITLCFYRMYFVVDFIKDFPRNNPITNEAFTGLRTGLYAIWGPDQYANPPKLASGWGWAEAATYIGIGTFLCLVLIFTGCIYRYFRKRKDTSFSYSPFLLVALFLTFFILGMGDFGPYSPYALLSHLPIFDSMRVSTRWLMWASLSVLFIIAAYKHTNLSRTINIILFITVIELFLSGSKVIGGGYFIDPQQYRPITARFGQEYKYNIPRSPYSSDPNYLNNYWYDENLYETTRNNLGQVIAGDSLIDTRQPNSTIRCGENQPDCRLITDNATITYWSPSKITIQRNAPGPILLNINPGRGWLVNNQYIFKDYKIVDPLRQFVIDDESKIINLEYAPKLSPSWLKHTIKGSLDH